MSDSPFSVDFDDRSRLWLGLMRFSLIVPRRLEHELQAEAGLSFFEYMVLAVLSEQPDRSMQMTDIAEFASASLSRLSHTAKRLEQQGLITRQQVPGHGRRTRAIVTDAGYDKVVSTAPGHVAEVRRLLIDDLTASELVTLAKVGEKVLRKIDDGCGSATGASEA